MKRLHWPQVGWLLSFLLISIYAQADTQVNVVGLFSDKAVVIINNGKPQTLSVGQSSPEGVKLLAADSGKATFEVEGKRKELGMGQAASVAGSAATAPGSVTLYSNPAGHYLTEGQINGATLKFLVDTGASTIALNGGDAKYAGIDYKKGERIAMSTANGQVIGYRVVVNTLKMGSLILNQVDAVVLEGGSPPVVLLGMSALNRLDMKREGIALTLTKKY
jgi:aspartyl protease family protein